jgi:hypothetical protein
MMIQWNKKTMYGILALATAYSEGASAFLKEYSAMHLAIGC